MSSFRFTPGASFIALLVLLNIVLAALYPSPFNAVAACILYGSAFIAIFRWRPKAVLFAAPIAFVHTSVLVSLIAVESGAFMKEMGAVGRASGAGALYALLTIVFLWAAAWIFGVLERKYPAAPAGAEAMAKRHALLMRWLPLAFGAFTILLLLAKGAATGFPMLQGFDRFAYRRAVGDPITLNLLNLKIVIAAFLGTAATLSPLNRVKWCYHGVFIAYLAASFLFGDKFFILIISSLVYLATQLVGDIALLKRRLKVVLPLAICVVIIASCLTIYVYSGGGRLSFESTALRLLDRISGQAQLWFLAFDRNFGWLRFDSEAAMLNLQSLFASPAADFVFEKRLAAFHFVWKYSPAQMYWSFVGNAGYVAPAMAFEAYLMELFGLVGTLLALLLSGIVLGLISFAVYAGVRSGNPYRALLPAHVYVQFYYLVVGGTIFSLLSVGTMKAYAAFAALQVLVWLWTKQLGNTAAPATRLTEIRS